MEELIKSCFIFLDSKFMSGKTLIISDIQQVWARRWALQAKTSGQMIHLPAADLILFIFSHSQIYRVNSSTHINAEAPAGWLFTSAAEMCPRFCTLTSWSGFVLTLQLLISNMEDRVWFIHKLCRGVRRVWKLNLDLPQHRSQKKDKNLNLLSGLCSVCHICWTSRWAKWSIKQPHLFPSSRPLPPLLFYITSHFLSFIFNPSMALNNSHPEMEIFRWTQWELGFVNVTPRGNKWLM